MAISETSLKNRILDAFEAAGADPKNRFSWTEKFAQAIASAVVAEIKSNAKANVQAGSSAGQWPIE